MSGASLSSLLLATIRKSQRSCSQHSRLWRNGLVTAAQIRRACGRTFPKLHTLRAEQVLTPAEAFYSSSKRVPLEDASGQIAAEMLSPYPPGIPRIIPGQRITDEQVHYLRISVELGTFPYDASDLELRTVRVVA